MRKSVCVVCVSLALVMLLGFGQPVVFGQSGVEADVRATRRFDMGTSDSPVAPGHIKITKEELYSPDSGYGWISAADIGFSDGNVLVTVHSLGNVNVPPFVVEVKDATSGELIGTKTAPGLEAPNDLEPRILTLQFPWSPPGDKGRVEVHIDPSDEVFEITESNNVIRQEIPPPPPEIPSVDWVDYWERREGKLLSVPPSPAPSGRGTR